MGSDHSRDIYAETLAVFDRRGDRYEPLTTPEVADELDAERRPVYKRLQNLVERGALETKKTGSNSRVWWRQPAVSSPTDGSDEGGTASRPDGVSAGGAESRDGPKTERGTPRPTDGTDGEREPGWRLRAMESLIDGVGIVNEAGEHLYVNEPHADVYGYDDPEAFLGEHWSMCYDEDELVRFEDEIIPRLFEEGAWRGEATSAERRRQDRSWRGKRQRLRVRVATCGGTGQFDGRSAFAS